MEILIALAGALIIGLICGAFKPKPESHGLHDKDGNCDYWGRMQEANRIRREYALTPAEAVGAVREAHHSTLQTSNQREQARMTLLDEIRQGEAVKMAQQQTQSTSYDDRYQDYRNMWEKEQRVKREAESDAPIPVQVGDVFARRR